MTELNEIEVIIVDDEELIAEDIKEICEAHGYKVVAVCYNGNSAIQALQNIYCDIALLDIKLEGSISGFQVIRHIQKLGKHFPFIYITSFADTITLQEAKNFMPMGYIVKPFTKEQLVSTIEIALYNNSQLQKPKGLNKMKIEELSSVALTEREYEILEFICDAKTNEQISKLVFLSVNTVKFHIKNLYEKLEVNSRPQLMKKINI